MKRRWSSGSTRRLGKLGGRGSFRWVFIAALEREDAAERAAYLDRVCAGDSAFRQRIEKLLERHDQAGGFLESPAAGLAASPAQPSQESPGTMIGPYKLLEQTRQRYLDVFTRRGVRARAAPGPPENLTMAAQRATGIYDLTESARSGSASAPPLSRLSLATS